MESLDSANQQCRYLACIGDLGSGDENSADYAELLRRFPKALDGGGQFAYNNDANSWRSSNTVRSSSNSLFSRSESCSCETALHNWRTSELTTGSMFFAPTFGSCKSSSKAFYMRKHGKVGDSCGPPNSLKQKNRRAMR